MEFGPLPEKRSIPSFVQEQSAEELAVKLIRQRSELEAAHQRELETVRKEADRLAEQLAMLVHKKRFSQPDPFLQSLRQLLKNEGISLITYVGEEVTETLESEQDIIEWLPPEDDEVSRVVDALEPEIIRQGRILHRAKLSCRQGNRPPEQYPEPVTASEEVPAAEETAPTEPAEVPQEIPAQPAQPEPAAETAEPEPAETPAPAPVKATVSKKPPQRNNASKKKKKKKKSRKK